MSKTSYIRGFCKAAKDAGVDPVALMKLAADYDREKYRVGYRDAILNAGNDASGFLNETELNQPLPSVKDIQAAINHDRKSNATDVSAIKGPNPEWLERFSSSLDQEPTYVNTMEALRNIVRGGIGTMGFIPHREIPENIFRGAWPAFTNIVGFGSAPARPRTQQVVLKRK